MEVSCAVNCVIVQYISQQLQVSKLPDRKEEKNGLCLPASWLRVQARPNKATIRAVCQILDGFHFTLPHQLPPEALQQQQQQQPTAVGHTAAIGHTAEEVAPDQEEDVEVVEMDDDAPDQEAEQDGEDEEELAVEVEDEGTGQQQQPDSRGTSSAARQAAAVQSALLRRVLPSLHRMLVSRAAGGEVPVARAPVALAIAKLVRSGTDLLHSLHPKPVACAIER
jgi:hypothetical protein